VCVSGACQASRTVRRLRGLMRSAALCPLLRVPLRVMVTSFITSKPEDDAERFLREFAMKRKWSKPVRDGDSDIDSAEDDEAVEAAEQFEAKYNFRFEEEEGGNIIGHARQVEGSVRRKDESRKQKRQQR
jgi:hypothetical protein